MTPKVEREEILQTIQHLLLCWTVFNFKLPDGEYDGLGQMRMAIASLKDLEVSLASDQDLLVR